jgi:CDP-diacylglycerol--serine O-phosphatidyltransferase
MIFITKFPTPAILTYASISCSIVGISLAFTQISWAIALLFICAILDISDGIFARSFKRSLVEKKFGIAIDSLADVLAFVALPSVIFFTLSSTVIVPIVYALCGITRLAVFTAEASPDTRIEYYRGLPITVAGFVIPVGFVLCRTFGGIESLSMIWLYAVLAGLFVLNIHIKKP